MFLNGENGNHWKIDGFEIEETTTPEIRWEQITVGSQKIGLGQDGLLYSIGSEGAQALEQNKKLQEAELVLSEFGWVNDSLIACSTEESGVLFINLNDPSYFELTDYHSGLPDNEIHDLFTDEFGGVWVCHEFGLTRIDPLFPAYSYTNFPGLDGNLIEAQRLHGDLWVNTSLGVYYFKEDSSFRNRVFRQKIERKDNGKNQATSTQNPNQIEEAKKGFLGGLFKRKNRAKNSQKSDDGFFKKLISPFGKKEQDQYVRKVERIMTGISYQFHKVPGSEGKFRQLLAFNDGILATSHSGIYTITKESTELVIEEAANYVFVLRSGEDLIVSTEEGLLKTYKYQNGFWDEVSATEFTDAILNVYEDDEGTIWLVGTTHIYTSNLAAGGLEISEGYEVNNRFYDELSVWEHDDRIYFINSHGYFRLDKKQDRIVRDTELNKLFGPPHHHLHNEKSRVWLHNSKTWHLLLPGGDYEEFNYLGIYPDLKYISYDEVLDRYWLITQDNQLLAYSSKTNPGLHKGYQLFIKRIQSNQGMVKYAKEIELRHDQNNLVIEMLKPDYLGILSPEYQYKLEGLSKDWSEWTHANLIDYSYLPSGEYKLIVRVRDAFGQLEESEMLTFRVGTPYWKEPWFYAIQVFILVMIVAITSKLDEENARNRILKSALSILTLVVVIEFLQSVIGAYIGIESTPVVDFLIDAGIAIMIFPLEWVLRKLMLEGGLSLAHLKRAKLNSGD